MAIAFIVTINRLDTISTWVYEQKIANGLVLANEYDPKGEKLGLSENDHITLLQITLEAQHPQSFLQQIKKIVGKVSSQLNQKKKIILCKMRCNLQKKTIAIKYQKTIITIMMS